ncbi:MAG TPA: hypothetical protein VGE14_01465 [Marmoricola sp.]
MLVRRLSIVAAATTAALMAGASPALAHYCFFTDPNVNANANRAGSTAFMPFSEYSDFTGLCTEGKEILAEAGGVTMDTIMNGRGSMAGGREQGTRTIGHLDFGAVFAAGPEAYEACDMEVPAWWFED